MGNSLSKVLYKYRLIFPVFVINSFIHSVFGLTTGPKPPPK